jgi:Transposase C of IS166 homeodomain
LADAAANRRPGANRLTLVRRPLRRIDSTVSLADQNRGASDPLIGVPITPDNLPDNPAALKRIIAAMAQDALVAQAEITRLKFQLARYRRAEFGRSSEKLARDAEQLELALGTLEPTKRNGWRRRRRRSPQPSRPRPRRRSRRGVRCQNICPERICGIPHRAAVLIAAARCAGSPMM